MYIIGGAEHVGTGFRHYNDVHTIDPSTGEVCALHTIGDVFVPRRGHTASCYLDRYILVFGGVQDSDDSGLELLSDALYILDTHLSKWTLKAPGAASTLWPFRRRGHMSCVYNDSLYIFGGYLASHSMNAQPINTLIQENAILFHCNLTHLFLAAVDDDAEWSWKQTTLRNFINVLHYTVLNQNGGSSLCLALAASGLRDGLWIFWGGTITALGDKCTILCIDLSLLDFQLMVYRSADPDGQVPLDSIPDALFCPAACIVGELFLMFGGTPFGGDGGAANADLFSLGNFTRTSLATTGNSKPPSSFLSAIARGSGSSAVSQLMSPFLAAFPEAPSMEAPCPRNGATLTECSANTALLFGGGRFKEAYYADCYLLEVISVPQSRNSKQDSKSKSDINNGDVMRFFSMMLHEARFEEWADVHFILDDGEIILGHRICLAARSQYFNRLLAGNFAESSHKSSNDGEKVLSVRLRDVDSVGLKEFIHYSYTGSFSSDAFLTVERICRLIVVADKMQSDCAYSACCDELRRYAMRSFLSDPRKHDKAEAVMELLHLISFAESISSGHSIDGASLIVHLVRYLHWFLIFSSQVPTPLLEEQDGAVQSTVETMFQSPTLRTLLLSMITAKSPRVHFPIPELDL